MRISRSFAIFAGIGVLNTATDIGLFVILRELGLALVLANIISTSVALAVSYSLNSRYTFGGTHSQRRLGAFIAVTLSGLWLLQPTLLWLFLHMIELLGIDTFIGHFVSDVSTVENALVKLCAVPFTLAWNYILYKRFVFKD